MKNEIDLNKVRAVYDACTSVDDSPPDGVVIWLNGRQFERAGGKWVELWNQPTTGTKVSLDDPR